jgi:hypothetical protein
MSTTSTTTRSQAQTKTDEIYSADYSNCAADAENMATQNAQSSFVVAGTNYTFSSAAAQGNPTPMGSPSQYNVYGQATDQGVPAYYTSPGCNVCSGPWQDDPASLTWSAPQVSADTNTSVTIGAFQEVKLTYEKSFGGMYLIPPGNAPQYQYKTVNIGVNAPLKKRDETYTRTLNSTSTCPCNNDSATCADFGQFDPGTSDPAVWNNACGQDNYFIFTTTHSFNSVAPNGRRVDVALLTCEDGRCCATCEDFSVYSTEAAAMDNCPDGNAVSCSFPANSPSNNPMSVTCANLNCWSCY